MSAFIMPLNGHIFTGGSPRSSVPAFYSLAGLVHDNLLVNNVATDDEENFSVKNFMGGGGVIYVGGSMAGNLAIEGLILLGADTAGRAAAALVEDWYETNKISVSQNPASVSAFDRAHKFWPVGLRVRLEDPEAHILSFLITGIRQQPETRGAA